VQSQTNSVQVHGLWANAIAATLAGSGAGLCGSVERWEERGAVPQVWQRRRMRFLRVVWEGGLIVQFCKLGVRDTINGFGMGQLILCTRPSRSVDIPPPCRARIWPLSRESCVLARRYRDLIAAELTSRCLGGQRRCVAFLLVFRHIHSRTGGSPARVGGGMVPSSHGTGDMLSKVSKGC
jgi:hypothetical protein